MREYVRVFRLVVVACVLAVTALSAAGAGRPAGPAGSGWRITDLGTLGATKISVAAINGRGQVIGWSGKRPFLWQDGKMTDLGWHGTTAMAINDKGQIIGTITIGSGWASSRAVVWQRGKTTRLGMLPGGEWSEADVINQQGDIAGANMIFDANLGDDFGHVVLWQDGKTVDLGMPGDEGQTPLVMAINERDQVVGYLDFVATNTQETFYPFIAEKGKGARLLGGGDLQGLANDINERGQIVGEWDSSNGREHAVLWQNGRMTNLGTLPGLGESYAYKINERGQIVGDSFNGHVSHAFLWENGKMTDLGTLGGDESYASEINNKGQIVGASTTTSGKHAPSHAVVWQNGKITSLPELSGQDAISSGALSINDQGQIFGTSTTNTGQHAVLWTLTSGA